MPAYDYCCEECFDTFEMRASMAKYESYLKDHKPRCPKCGSSRTVRAITPVHIALHKANRTSAAAGGSCCPGGRCI